MSNVHICTWLVKNPEEFRMLGTFMTPSTSYSPCSSTFEHESVTGKVRMLPNITESDYPYVFDTSVLLRLILQRLQVWLGGTSPLKL